MTPAHIFERKISNAIPDLWQSKTYVIQKKTLKPSFVYSCFLEDLSIDL